MYEVFEKLCQMKGVKAADVCKETGISKSAISQWKSKGTNLRVDTLQKIADYFGVSVEYLIDGKNTEKESTSGKKYYFSDETAEMAQKIFENPKLHALFDATPDVSPDALQKVTELLLIMKGE